MKTMLNRRLYTKAGIETAISAYQHLAKIQVASDGDYWSVSFSNVDADVKDIIVDEFNNYSLYATIAGKKTW